MNGEDEFDDVFICDEDNCNFETSDLETMRAHAVEKHGMTEEQAREHWDPI